MAIVFLEIGQEVHITGGLLEDAVNEGVRKGYEKGYLRKSVVEDPFLRVNTKDNTPAILYTKIVAGDYLSKGIYPIYDQSKDNTIAGYTNKKEGLCDNVPAVLFGDHSRVIKYINTPFFIGADGVKIIRPKINEIIPEFLYYDLKYHTIPNTGYNRHFKFVKMLKLTKASMEKQNEFLLIARQADKSKFELRKSIDAIDKVISVSVYQTINVDMLGGNLNSMICGMIL